MHACDRNIRHLVVDAVGTCQQLRVFLRAVLPYIPKITVEIKADAKYALVGAASIIAKVHRDREHERHTFTETGALREKLEALRSEMGSGYPADRETKAWLGQVMDPVFGVPSNVRSSWKTVRRLQLEADVPMLERQAVPRPDPAAPLGRAFSEVRIQPSSSMDDPAPVADAIWQKITEAEKRKLKFPRRKKKRKSTAPVADNSSRTRKPPRWRGESRRAPIGSARPRKSLSDLCAGSGGSQEEKRRNHGLLRSRRQGKLCSHPPLQPVSSQPSPQAPIALPQAIAIG